MANISSSILTKECINNYFEIINNPNESLEKKKLTIKNISDTYKTHKINVAHELIELIQFQSDLIESLFKCILIILPDDYLSKGYKPFLNNIINFIADSDISLSEIYLLVKKDKNIHLSPIISLIIYRLYKNDTEYSYSIKFLYKLCVKYNCLLNDIQTEKLTYIAKISSNKNIRSMMIKLIQNSTFLNCEDTLYNLKISTFPIFFNDKLIVKNIKSAVNIGFRLTEEMISYLIDHLIESAWVSDIIDILRKAVEIQRINHRYIEKYLKTILFQQPNLLFNFESVKIIINFMKQNGKIEKNLILSLLDFAKKKSLKQLFFSIAEVSTPDILDNFLQLSINIITNENEDINVRLKASNCLHKNEKTKHISKHSSTIVNSIKKMVFNDNVCDKNQLILCNTFIKLLQRVNYEDEIKEFPMKFYEKIKSVHLNKYNNLNNLNQYIYDPSVSYTNKINLLQTMIEILSTYNCLNANVFKEFSPDIWSKELLCSSLVMCIAQYTKTYKHNEYMDEYNLKNFINRLDDFLYISNKTPESLLKNLLIIQNNNKFNFVQMNDLLLLLTYNSELINEILNNSIDSIRHLEKQSEKWLNEKLLEKGINHISQVEKQLILDHTLLTIESFLEVVNNETYFKMLIDILKNMNYYMFTLEMKENFLLYCIRQNININDWKVYLVHILIKIEKKYKFDSTNNTNYTSYIYDIKDITKTSKHYMKSYLNDFNIITIQSLTDLNDGLNNISESRCILILLNLYHNWISLAILSYDEIKTILCNFSEGDLDRVDELKLILKKKFENIKFIYNITCTQSEYLSSTIALNNLKIMAKNIKKDCKTFINNFEQFKFPNKNEASKIKRELFPKLYIKELCIIQRKVDIIKHHYGELIIIKNKLSKLLEKIIVIIEGEKITKKCIILSISFPDDDLLFKQSYNYFYSVKFIGGNFSKNPEILNIIIKSFKTSTFSLKKPYHIIIDSKNTKISKQNKRNIKRFNVNCEDDVITNMLSNLDLLNFNVNYFILNDYVKFTKFQQKVYNSKFVNYDILHFHSFENKDINDSDLYCIKVLLSLEWTFNSIIAVVLKYDKTEKRNILENCINIINTYKMREYFKNENGDRLLDLLCSNIDDLEDKIKSLANVKILNCIEKNEHITSRIQKYVTHKYEFPEKEEIKKYSEKCVTDNKSYKNSNTSNALNFIDELENGGEAGLPHLGTLSNIIKRPINVYNNRNRFMYTIGQYKNNNPIGIQYHEPGNINKLGHWTLVGNKEPIKYNNDNINNCLFNVVGEQIGINPIELRENVIKRMKKDIYIVENLIYDFKRLANYKKEALAMGGAVYKGYSSRDCAKILDTSEGVSGHGYSNLGHPRGHASAPGFERHNVESYSMTGEKTAFLSRSEQDLYVHLALSSSEAQNAMKTLNMGSNREVVHIPTYTLNEKPPMIGRWIRGSKVGDNNPARDIVLVLQHHIGKKDISEADVHIQTAYPRF